MPDRSEPSLGSSVTDSSVEAPSPEPLGTARERLLTNPHDAHVAPSAISRLVQRVLVGVFVALLVVVALLIGVDRWRRGTFTLGVAMMWLASIRWIVDSDVLGVLAVRSRKFDSLFSAAIGAMIVWLSVSVDPLGS